MDKVQCRLKLIRLKKLKALEQKEQNKPNAFRRTMGVPGARYWPEIEKLENQILDYTAHKNTSEKDAVWAMKELEKADPVTK